MRGCAAPPYPFFVIGRIRTYSLADAISFVVMWQRSMSTAFTLDADFAAEGFTILPTRT